ncbi:hybrid sensor histidine kinase/response regulator [Desulfopila aestuarii]|uniref:histidine kinase n=1 Tax=Desulfopila aestuarii DSM 18488 TaxID=1121416 RepID=A0A1M7YM91_9BACT|nr:PAS domain-containing sensor histidine kinase [Desulfopila aestuarii]SHO53751.1 PAS domain S-box-containing protein [Desulfopila aestuarii DSM 18488]
MKQIVNDMKRWRLLSAYIFWGIHKANYPFLRPVLWFAPWGYLLGAVLELIVAMGLILIYFKKTKNTLIENESRLINAQRIAKVGDWAWQLKDNQLIWSDETYRIFGQSPEKFNVTVEAFENVIHPDDYEKFVRERDSALRKNRAVDIEHRIVLPDKSIRWVHEISSAEKDENNNVIKVTGTVQDITDRKNAETALIESQKRFTLAMEASQDGLFDWNLITNEIYYSPGWKIMLGYNDDELPNDFSIWENLTEPKDVERSWTMQQELINKKCDRFEMEFKMKHKDGHWVDILSRAKAVFDEDGKAVRIIGTHVDITERKKYENQLKTLNFAIENSLNGFDIVKAEGVLIYANKAFITMYGYDRAEEIIGTSPADLCVDPQLPTKVIQKLQESGEYEFEHVAKRKDGSTFDVLMYARLAHDEQGNEIYPTSCIDITERQKALIEREQLERQLQQAHKMESIGTLAGGIAHDFNNILGAILGYAEMAQEGSPAGSMVRKDIEQVIKASHRAKDLVKQILSFSRQAETDYIPLQPAVIIKEALKMLRSSLPTTIDIQQDIDPEAGPILADPTQIHQIINNLCTNAFHAMEETGGTLNISLKKRELFPADLISEPHVQPGHFVEISVGDSGPGIAPEIINKIFDPFFTTKEVGKGTGMGLAIIHGIAKKSGGLVSCKSSPGEGATFYVYIPVYATTTHREAETTPLELIQTGVEHILFIDDEEMLAEMGRTMLERLGYSVTVETNSIEALKIIQSQPDRFDLVITDQTMPGMTGSDLARRILQIRPELPIILCTGFSNQISEEKARIYGIKGFAMKPLAKKDLATLIRKLLDGEK